MADKKKMSVEDILAACRKGGDAGGAAAAPSQPTAKSTDAESSVSPAVPTEAPAAAKPAAAAPKAKPGAMSVTDILAAARAGKATAGGATASAPPAAPKAEAAKPAETKPAAPKATAAKPAAKPASEKPATEKLTAGAAKAPVADTASILAAARGTGKPGPVSKSELKEKPSEPTGKKKLEVPPMPAKPAYAQAKPAAAGETRRGFFASATSMVVGSSMALGFASLAVTHVLWVLGLARFMFPNILTEPPTRFKVGFPDTLAPGQVDERFKAAFGVWIVRHEYEGQSQIFALKTVCTHLGCTPNWLESEQKFKCPCHGSGFYKEGINFEGPAPRPLERYAIRVADDGQLEVDKSRVYHEETGQWRDPASFVPA